MVAAALSGGWMRTRVYIDGFNLYYGCLKGTPAKWLNPALLCDNLLPRNRVDAIRYFTATVSARPNDPDQATRQQTYLRALATEPRISVHLGHFLTHEVNMPDAAAWRQGRYLPRRVVKTEEKGSDVNLATYLLTDAFDDLFDCAVLVSNDSDLKEPLSIVRNRFGKTVGLLNPQQIASRALIPLAHFRKQIRYSALNRAQFPQQMTDKVGTFTKPARW
jgi:uncharacterized LabA/DUF88 family protein